jgi:hypothetical protein
MKKFWNPISKGSQKKVGPIERTAAEDKFAQGSILQNYFSVELFHPRFFTNSCQKNRDKFIWLQWRIIFDSKALQSRIRSQLQTEIWPGLHKSVNFGRNGFIKLTPVRSQVWQNITAGVRLHVHCVWGHLLDCLPAGEGQSTGLKTYYKSST